MSFWEKVKDLFDPMRQSAEADTPAPEPAPDSIEDVKDTVIEKLLGSLRPFRGKDDFMGITLWINDASFAALNDDEFISRLRVAFDDASFRSLGKGKILLRQGRPEEGIAATEFLKDTYWFSYVTKTPSGVARPAVLTIRDGEGTFEGQAVFDLDPSLKTSWKLGRGRTTRKGGVFRMNDIIVEGNDYVSSAHLDILLRDGLYYVKVMPSGCRSTGGSPTKLIRGGKESELTDINAFYPLEDGDYLDLGKSLLFEFNLK